MQGDLNLDKELQAAKDAGSRRKQLSPRKRSSAKWPALKTHRQQQYVDRVECTYNLGVCVCVKQQLKRHRPGAGEMA